MPVRDVTTALPPSSNWLPTRMFVTRPKPRKMQWVTGP